MTRPSTRLARTAAAATTVLAVTWLGAGSASAHISPTTSEVPAGGYTDVQLLLPHGCEGSPTTKIEVKVPEALTSASPYVNPGWTAEVTKEELETPIDDGHGGQITERDSVITWTAEPGNELPDHFRTTFGIGFQAPDTPGERLDFPVIQTCEEGVSDWTTIYDPASGDEEPEKPAPSVAIVEASDDGHGGDDAAEGDGAEADTPDGDEAAAPAPATSDDEGDDDGAATGLAIGGLVAGLAGLGLGGAAFAKARKA